MRNSQAGMQGCEYAVMQSSSDGIIIVDQDNRVTEFNPTAEKMFGYTRAGIVGKLLAETVVPPGMHKAYQRAVEHVRAADQGPSGGVHIEVTAIRADGSEFCAELAIAPLSLRRQSACVIFVRDISDHKQAEASLRNSQKRSRQTVDASPAMMWLSGIDTLYGWLNKPWLDFVSRPFPEVTHKEWAQLHESVERLNAAMTYAGIGSWECDLLTGRVTQSKQMGLMFGKPAGWAHSDLVSWRRLIHPEDRAQTIAQFEGALADGVGYHTEYRVLWEDGVTVRWLESTVTILRDETGRAVRVVGLDRDITERKQAEARIQSLANYNYDALTGLPNRTLLADLLAQAIAQANRDGHCLAVLFIDLDQFKTINDSLGHLVGDKLLKQVAARLSKCRRRSDFLARLGGDEFLMALSQVKQAQDAAQIAQKIVNTLARPYRTGGHTLNTSCSIGISIYPNDGKDVQTLMRGADMAMYHAKDAGRNHYQFFSTEMDARAAERLAIGNALRQALKREQFVLHYQPYVDLPSGRIAGIEALIRWRHPDLGLLPPARFIPYAEETGIIVQIGQWVLRTACEQMKAWQSEGIAPVRLAVNLSARQFRQTDLAQQIATTLKKTGLAANALELEITESMAMQDPRRTIKLLHELRDMGIGLTIDDFGTGYSSLTYLKAFPIRSLKIDRAFVDGIPSDGNDAAITTATIALAQSLGLSVVAEGVETIAQQAFLTKAGCNQGQGYLFGPPRPASELLVGRLRDHRSE
ncbi:MAG: EAL domain-containing protein [Gammaproteobacteria bacterium]